MAEKSPSPCPKPQTPQPSTLNPKPLNPKRASLAGAGAAAHGGEKRRCQVHGVHRLCRPACQQGHHHRHFSVRCDPNPEAPSSQISTLLPLPYTRHFSVRCDPSPELGRSPPPTIHLTPLSLLTPPAHLLPPASLPPCPSFPAPPPSPSALPPSIPHTDRAATVRALADPKTTARDLTRPGHIFPLRAVLHATNLNKPNRK